MKILLFGKNGQIGRELQDSLSPLGEVRTCDRQTANFEDSQKLQAIITDYVPDIIINAAAYTAVDKAESEFNKARQINGEAVKVLAEEAKKQGAWFIHYSTDYVFDGKKTKPYVETDTPHPLNAYGKTKLLGEEAVKKVNGNHLILRTSGVYSPHGSNFVKTILSLARERNEIKVVSDQFSTPTSAKFIADTTALVLDRIRSSSHFHKKNFEDKDHRDRVFEDRDHGDRVKDNPPIDPKQISGIYHLTPVGKVSWWDLAIYIINQARENKMALQIKPKGINPIPADQYPSQAKRPKNSQLDSTKISKTFGIELPSWQTHIQKLIRKWALEEEMA